jgi:hypothetical protein
MSDETKVGPATDAASAEAPRPEAPSPQPGLRDLLPLPGLAAIALYMFVLAGVSIVGVVNGQFHAGFLLFSAFFVTAALGLLRLMRWAWAMALGAIVLLVALFTWKFSISHQYPYLVQGLLNLVFFLYLIRTEVRSMLK